MGARNREVITMAKDLLLEHDRRPETSDVPPVDLWTPEDVEAHLTDMSHVADPA